MKNEQENIKIDEYNFTQLEKFKSALINIQDGDNKVMSLGDFNETFNQDIDPVQNCYYISTTDIYWWEEDIGRSIYLVHYCTRTSIKKHTERIISYIQNQFLIK